MRRGGRYLGPLVWVVLAVALAGGAVAQAPDRSPRPEPRATAVVPAAPGVVGGVVAGAVGAQPAAGPGARAPRGAPRPVARPGNAPEAPTGPAFAGAVSPEPASPRPSAALPGALAGLVFNGGVGSRLALARSLRPPPRPDGLVRNVRAAATRQTPGRVAQLGVPGALCGVPGLVGEQLAPMPGRIDGCGIGEPVRIRAVDGIVLSTPATLNCQAARALRSWVAGSVVPAVGDAGGGVRSLRVVASYACRARNNRPGAPISEHGRGNAIDIAGIGLADGSELTVLTDWRSGREGRILRALHAGACGPFGTVLGPESDRFHQDHFHFDTATHRSGAFCR